VTGENLLSGLIGGLVVGVLGVAGVFLLVRADNQRWRAENLAGTRLVYHEVRFILRGIRSTSFDNSLLRLLTGRVWEAEQVRVASILPPDELEEVVMAYVRFTALGLIAAEDAARPNPKPITDWLKNSKDGPKFFKSLVEGFIKAEAILERRTAPTTDASRGWLGVSGGGLVRL
jgi:hypothetical protein